MQTTPITPMVIKMSQGVLRTSLKRECVSNFNSNPLPVIYIHVYIERRLMNCFRLSCRVTLSRYDFTGYRYYNPSCTSYFVKSTFCKQNMMLK